MVFLINFSILRKNSNNSSHSLPNLEKISFKKSLEPSMANSLAGIVIAVCGRPAVTLVLQNDGPPATQQGREVSKVRQHDMVLTCPWWRGGPRGHSRPGKGESAVRLPSPRHLSPTFLLPGRTVFEQENMAGNTQNGVKTRGLLQT